MCSTDCELPTPAKAQILSVKQCTIFWAIDHKTNVICKKDGVTVETQSAYFYNSTVESGRVQFSCAEYQIKLP